MDLKLVLKDGSAIDIAEAGLTQHYVVLCDTNEEFVELWEQMTAENLSEIQIANEETVLQTIVNSTLSGTQTVVNDDGTITGHFYLTGGVYTQQDAEYTQAGKILLGEEE